MRASVAAATHIGGKTSNQDTYFIKPQHDGSLFLGVFDGHGTYGKEVAEVVRDFFVLSDPAGNPITAFTKAEAVAKAMILTRATAEGKAPFEYQDGTLLYKVRKRCMAILRGGTTASLVYIAGNTLRVSHVGDTEVMVIHEETGEFTVLTKDHSTTSLTEYERIIQEAPVTPKVEFAFTSSHRPVFVRKPTGYDWMPNPQGGARWCNLRKDWSAYLRGTAPADVNSDCESLNMLRAIGDFSLKKHGVTCRHDTVEHTLKPGRNIVLAASDGLFDNYTYEDLRDTVISSIKKESSIQAAVNAIVSDGLTAGVEAFGTSCQDNITAVLAIVDVPK